MRRAHRMFHARALSSDVASEEVSEVEAPQDDSDLLEKIAKIEKERTDALRALGGYDDH